MFESFAEMVPHVATDDLFERFMAQTLAKHACVGIAPPGGDSKAGPAAWLGPEPHLKVRVNEQLLVARSHVLLRTSN